MGEEKGRRWDAHFFGLTSWPTAAGSLPGLHSLEKERQGGVTQEAESSNCVLEDPKQITVLQKSKKMR